MRFVLDTGYILYSKIVYVIVLYINRLWRCWIVGQSAFAVVVLIIRI